MFALVLLSASPLPIQELAGYVADLPLLLRGLRPELALTAAWVLVLVLDLALGRRRPQLGAWLALGGLALALLLWAVEPRELALAPWGLQADMLSWLARGLSLSFVALALVFAALYPAYRDSDAHRGELWMAFLAMALACLLAARSRSLLLVFLSVEFLSVASYLLTAYLRGRRPAAEAAMKYLIYGVVSAAVMLYGLSLWYGLLGSDDILQPLPAAVPQAQRLVISLLLLAGLAYKMGAWPFHFWMPDVFQGAGAAVAALLASAPKVVALVVILRLWSVLAGDQPGLQGLLCGVGCVGFALGNVGALRQKHFLRLMAWSGIANAGFLLVIISFFPALGIATPAVAPERLALLYLVPYGLATWVALVAGSCLQQQTGSWQIRAWRGLGPRQPLVAFALGVSLLSLAGFPPFWGFFPKLAFFLYSTLSLPTTGATGALPLAVLGWLVLNTLTGFYYYLQPLALLFRAGADTRGAQAQALPNLSLPSSLDPNLRRALYLTLPVALLLLGALLLAGPLPALLGLA